MSHVIYCHARNLSGQCLLKEPKKKDNHNSTEDSVGSFRLLKHSVRSRRVCAWIAKTIFFYKYHVKLC